MKHISMSRSEKVCMFSGQCVMLRVTYAHQRSSEISSGSTEPANKAELRRTSEQITNAINILYQKWESNSILVEAGQSLTRRGLFASLLSWLRRAELSPVWFIIGLLSFALKNPRKLIAERINIAFMKSMQTQTLLKKGITNSEYIDFYICIGNSKT